MKLRVLMKHHKINPSFVNMFWYPNTADPEGTLLRLWKQLKPLQLDRLILVDSRGNLVSNGCQTRKTLRVRVIVRMHGFYRLFAKNPTSGKTTSRHATPPGDGRGIPKHFQDFGRFSKCSSSVSTPSPPPALLAGFALRSSQAPGSSSRTNPARTVGIRLFRRPRRRRLVLVMASIDRMEDLSAMDSLFQLIEDMDSSSPPAVEEPSLPDINDAELVLNLRMLGELDAPTLSLPEPPSLFALEPLTSPALEPPISSASQPPTSPAPQLPTLPAPQLPTLPAPQPPTSPDPEPSDPPAPEQLVQVIQIQILPLVAGPPGPPTTGSQEDQGYSSPPTSPPPSPAATNNPGETKEQKRLREQKEACQRYRLSKKMKKQEEQVDLEQLEARNRELRRKLELEEEMVARMRQMVKEVMVGKRKRDDEDDDREGKLRKQ